MRRYSFAALALIALCPQAWGQTQLVYSNLTTFTGSSHSNGGAATDPGNGANTLTAMAADDIAMNPSFAAYPITSMRWAVGNLNSTAVSTRMYTLFYAANGPSGGPGTLLTGFVFNPVTLAAGTVTTFSFTPATPIGILPVNFWAGLAFDNNSGGTGATAAQLNLLGNGTFNPPTVGSSQDLYFQSSNNSFLTNNPSGGFFFFNGTPVANFGWEFTVGVPEPATYALFGLASMTGAGGFFWNRRKKQQALVTSKRDQKAMGA